MRSDLVFGALSHVSNRYQLCQLASKATRKLHKPNTRLQDTTNEVLVRFQAHQSQGHWRRQAYPRLGPWKPSCGLTPRSCYYPVQLSNDIFGDLFASCPAALPGVSSLLHQRIAFTPVCANRNSKSRLSVPGALPLSDPPTLPLYRR